MANALWNVWNDHEHVKIPGTTYTVQGFSIAALRTNFYIKDLGIMLDAGISANHYPDYIFVTHGHMDHCANLPCHLYGKNDGKIKIFVPNGTVDQFSQYIDSSIILGKDSGFGKKDLDSDMRFHEIIGVSEEKTYELQIRGRDFKIEIIKCDHSIPCVGYGFIEKRKKLKEEYKTLSGKEIALLRKQDIDVNQTIEHNVFCFLGDTSPEVLKDVRLAHYGCIFIECTFILENEIDQAKKTKHMHWKDLEPYVRLYPHITFILFHFSQRYKKSEVIDFFKKQEISNIICWAN